MEKRLTISYSEYDSIDELEADDQALVRAAMKATDTAYVPYSHFHVGAAVRLEGGVVCSGSNQENLAYPSGLCAERTTLFAASAAHPGKRMEALAVVGRNPEGVFVEAAPCGACRQVMAEYQMRQQSPMRVLCYLEGGRIRCFSNVESLLPFVFAAEF